MLVSVDTHHSQMLEISRLSGAALQRIVDCHPMHVYSTKPSFIAIFLALADVEMYQYVHCL